MYMKKSTTPAGIIKGCLQCLYAAVLCLAAFFQLQIASGVTNVWGDVIFQYLVWNLVLLGGVFLLLCLPWKRVCTGGILFCVIISLLGIANHYTLALHGSLLTVEQFQNARTALSVIGSYNLLSPNLLPGLFVQLAFLAGGILLSWGEYVLCEKRLPSLRRERPVRVGVSLLLLLSAAVLFIGGDATPYLKTVRNSWEPATTVQYHGYPMVRLSKNPFGAFRQVFAVCCAHNLSPGGGQIPHLQPVKYVPPGTCPGRTCFLNYFTPNTGKETALF